MEALRLLLVFVVIIIALRLKVPVGLTLFGAGFITALLYKIPLLDILIIYKDLLLSERFILLTLLVIQITFIGGLMKELKYLDKLLAACMLLPGGAKTAVPAIPALIGFMPMPGGSLMSAPLVDGILKDGKYKPEFKLVANYWFRHQVEFFWPVYAGLILTEAITGLPLIKVSIMQLPFSIFIVVIGYFFFIRKITNDSNDKASLPKALYGIVITVWPILLAIFLYGVFKIEMTLSLLISLLSMIAVTRPKLANYKYPLKKALSIGTVFLIYGILSFQQVLEASGAIESIPKLAIELQLPSAVIVFLVCFIIGMLTGMVSAYVGLGYAFLAGFLYQNGLNPSLIMLGYLSGFVGIMLSPAHVCLIVTNQYFKSELSQVYKVILAPITILFILGTILTLTPWPDLFK